MVEFKIKGRARAKFCSGFICTCFGTVHHRIRTPRRRKDLGSKFEPFPGRTWFCPRRTNEGSLCRE